MTSVRRRLSQKYVANLLLALMAYLNSASAVPLVWSGEPLLAEESRIQEEPVSLTAEPLPQPQQRTQERVLRVPALGSRLPGTQLRVGIVPEGS